MYDLINIFDIFLPQLLLYPNPADPLNAEAAALHMKNQDKFKEKCGDYVKKYASLTLYNKLVAQSSATTDGGKDNQKDDEDQGSELSQTSDIEQQMDEDEDMQAAGSNDDQEEVKQQHE